MEDAMTFTRGNAQTAQYLKFYVEMEGSPGYAVLLNGPWGCGKTTFIRNFQKAQAERRFVYVSLYGVSSITEIEDRVFQQLHPILASKPLRIVAKTLKGALKKTLEVDLDDDNKVEVSLGIPEVDIEKILSDSRKYILIFDDIERCRMIHDVLGYINHFVEHQGQKVILIGHQEEIAQSDDYRRKSEKLIGRIFTIKAELAETLSESLSSVIDRHLKAVLERNRELILEIYKRAGCANLRTLKYAIIEYQRLYSQLPEKAREHEAFQSACINAFFSVCVELRSGRMRVEEIKRLTSTYTSYLAQQAIKKGGDQECPELAQIYERHFGSSLEPMVPSEDALFYFFEYGAIPEPVMDDAIQGSRFFVDERTPTWMKLWHFHSLSDDEFTKFYDEVLREFTEHKFRKQGEIRHVVGLLLFFSKNRMAELVYEKCVELISKVVDEMISVRAIEDVSPLETRFHRFDDAYAGLGFTDNGDEHFKKISGELRAYQEKRKIDKARESTSNLISLLRSDSKGFFRILTVSQEEDQRLLEVPVLAYLPIKEFVKVLIEMDPSDAGRINVGYTLAERYKYLAVYPALTQELPWLKELEAAIGDALKDLGQPTRYQLEQIKDKFLGQAIKTIENAPRPLPQPQS